MLTLQELVTLERSLRGSRVLSVYLPRPTPDPAVQHAWRVQLDHELERARSRVAESSRADRAEFERCVQMLEGALAGPAAGATAQGRVAFITPGQVRHAGPLYAPVPVLAVWATGAFVAPYLRVLKESQPVIIAVMDARKATVYRYRAGTLEAVSTLRTHHDLTPPSHMGDTPRVGFHAGTRGKTGRDTVQRKQLAGMTRMLTELAESLTTLAGDAAWIVLGGIPRVVAHSARLLEPLAPRLHALGSLDVHASAAAIADAARRGASQLRDARDLRQIEEIAAHSDGRPLGALGRAAVEAVLQLSNVGALYVSERYLAEHAEEATEALRRAFDQHAVVEEVSGEAARRLDQHEGIAVRFRYPPVVGSGKAAESAPRQASVAQPVTGR